MANTLKYSSDEFTTKTLNSDEKAIKLFTFHDSNISLHHTNEPLDPVYTLMYGRTHPLLVNAQTIYNQVDSFRGKQVGQTERINARLKVIKGKKGLAHNWYARTQAVYGISDPSRVLEIWSTGLKPFRAKKDKVISALNTVSLNIGIDTNTDMIALKAEIDAEYAIINPGRVTQVLDMSATELKLAELHAACKACMKMEYRNSGLILDKFPDNENGIQESFHDMELLLSKQQTKWDIGLAILETKDIAQRTQIAQSKFRAKVTGGDGMMYLASTPGGIDSTGVPLVDGVENKFTAAEFHVTDYGINRHITIVNGANNLVRFNLNMG